MDDVIRQIKKEEIYNKTEKAVLIKGDSLEILKKIEKDSINMIFADPPYFLSNDGITCKSGKMESVNKGKWDKSEDIHEIYDFNKNWLSSCRDVLDENGTIWVSGTYHNIFSIGYVMQELGFKILNTISWYKRNAPPNLSCRYFVHSCEYIIWAAKSRESKHTFNYEIMKEINDGKQMRDFWDITAPKKIEKAHGKHPTQKPLELLNRIVEASTNKGDIVLDPFNGSGTTGVAAVNLNRNYIGIEMEDEFLEISSKRLMEK